MTLVLRLTSGARTIEPAEAHAMLSRRAGLPGAYGWDQAAHVLRALEAEGVGAIALLPLALPTSWMVNAKATSRTFRAWLTPRWHAAFEGVLAALDPSQPWPELDGARIQGLVDELARAPGAGLAALTKVLALLRPSLVPLMDDSALAVTLGAVPLPETDDAPTAGPEHFTPMMDWFHRELARNERALVDLARDHTEAVLEPAQVLDRVLWYVSFGHRHFPPG